MADKEIIVEVPTLPTDVKSVTIDGVTYVSYNGRRFRVIEETPNMWTRPEVRIKSSDFQKMIEDFTGTYRDFTAFSTTKLDHIAKFYIPMFRESVWMYSRYDTSTDELVFKGPPELDTKWFADRGLENIRVAEIDRPLQMRLLKP